MPKRILQANYLTAAMPCASASTSCDMRVRDVFPNLFLLILVSIIMQFGRILYTLMKCGCEKKCSKLRILED